MRVDIWYPGSKLEIQDGRQDSRHQIISTITLVLEQIQNWCLGLGSGLQGQGIHFCHLKTCKSSTFKDFSDAASLFTEKCTTIVCDWIFILMYIYDYGSLIIVGVLDRVLLLCVLLLVVVLLSLVVLLVTVPTVPSVLLPGNYWGAN